MGRRKKLRGIEKEFYCVREFSYITGINAQTIYNRLQRNSPNPFPIKPKRFGKKLLFSREDVVRFRELLCWITQSHQLTAQITLALL